MSAAVRKIDEKINAEFVISITKEFLAKNWYLYLVSGVTTIAWAPIATIAKSETSTAFTDAVVKQGRKKVIDKLWIFIGVFFGSHALYQLRNYVYEETHMRALKFVSEKLYERVTVYLENVDSADTDVNVTEIIQLTHHCGEMFTNTLAYFLNDVFTAFVLLLSFAVYMMKMDGRFGALVSGAIIIICIMCLGFIWTITYRSMKVNEAERRSLRQLENIVANSESIATSGSAQDTRSATDKFQKEHAAEKRKYIASVMIMFATWTVLLTVLMITIFYSVALSKRLPLTKVQSLITASLLLTDYFAVFADDVQKYSNTVAGMFDPLAIKVFNKPAEAIADAKRISLPDNVSGRLRAVNMSYRFPSGSADTIQNLNFDIPQGSVVLVKGHSGSGKTTLTKLLNCMLMSTSGELWLGECNASTHKRMDWRKAVFTVSQRLTLFDGTVAENILFGTGLKEAGADDVRDMVKALNLSDVLPDVHSKVGSSAPTGGGIMSGGMAKIIVLLRAVLRTCLSETLKKLMPRQGIQRSVPLAAKIVIFDEPMAGLDENSRNKVYELLNTATSGLTAVYVTHLDDFDEIADFTLRMPECTLERGARPKVQRPL